MRPKYPSFGWGLSIALLSAFFFGMSGTLAAGLLKAGWSPLGIVVPRVGIGAAVMVVPAVIALRGRWRLLLRNWRLLLGYGLFGITVPQLGHFSAVQYLQVAQALLIQYLAPLAIVIWLWIRRGERPGRRTVLGSVLAMGGLVLVLQVLGAGPAFDIRGLIWSLVAMVGNAAYFVYSSDDTSGLPPIVLAAGGCLVATIVLCLVALLQLLPVATASVAVAYAGLEVPWWLPLVFLGVLSSAASYVTGIMGARLLGTRLASFVGLSEVLFAIILAALLVGQMLTVAQVLGGVLVLAGVVLVKLGETTRRDGEPVSAESSAPGLETAR